MMNLGRDEEADEGWINNKVWFPDDIKPRFINFLDPYFIKLI